MFDEKNKIIYKPNNNSVNKAQIVKIENETMDMMDTQQ